MAAASTGKNVIIDGSLRNAGWHQLFFERIRSEFPEARLAIIHVAASPSHVLARAAKRGEETGRLVPEATLLAALDEVPGHAVASKHPSPGEKKENVRPL